MFRLMTDGTDTPYQSELRMAIFQSLRARRIHQQLFAMYKMKINLNLICVANNVLKNAVTLKRKKCEEVQINNSKSIPNPLLNYKI